jgi:hypothetical protein
MLKYINWFYQKQQLLNVKFNNFIYLVKIYKLLFTGTSFNKSYIIMLYDTFMIYLI